MSEPARATPSADDLLARATELIDAAGRAGLPMRLLGGLGVFAVARSARRPPLSRAYRDFDLAVPVRQGPAATRAMVGAGFLPDKHFNALHGARRMIFQAPEGYAVDVLIGIFEMCHRLDIQKGFSRDGLTIAPEDLLLTKLQIVRIETKDLADGAALLLDLAPGQGEGAIETTRFVAPLADDWGFFHTVELNLGKLRAFADDTLPPEQAAVVVERAGALGDAMEAAGKSVRWKLRARVGERVTWYEMPEEIE
ncbi:MAG: hypothetical protein HY240_08930 [Actinobacteria bacterium]|nr:hypothetical protein [Actinomycetota bacterium]